MKEKYVSQNSMNLIGRHAVAAILGATVLLNGFSAQAELLDPEEALIKYKDTLFAPASDLEWFQDAHFGVFMHWGPCSIKASEISWSRQGSRGADGYADSGVPEDIYNNLYKEFNPVGFDAEAWVQMVAESGAKYLIFTTKHHDGFCMFDAKNTGYKITNTPFKRDICKELADACHNQGIKLFWYYSQPDWTHPDYKTENHENYRAYMYEHLRTLLSDYGKIDGVWFDCLGTSWKDWNTPEMVKMMRELQPGLLINSRWGWGMPDVEFHGDYQNPEQSIGHFMVDTPWETCATITGGWSWTGGSNPKSGETCLRMLIECAGSGGNLALNTGPKPDGMINADDQDAYRYIGQWLRKYGESIYGTRGGPYKPGHWGVSTHKENRIYLHVMSDASGDVLDVILPPIDAQVRSARAMGDFQVDFTQNEQAIELVLKGDLNGAVDNIVVLELDRDAAGLEPVDSMCNLRQLQVKAIRSSSELYQAVSAEKLLENGGKGEFVAGIHHKPYWSPSRSDTAPWLEIEFEQDELINALSVEEHIGVCATRAFELQYECEGEWKSIHAASEIGLNYSLLINPVECRKIRLLIKDSVAETDVRISALKAFYVNKKLSPDKVLTARESQLNGPVILEEAGYLGYWIKDSMASWNIECDSLRKYEVAFESACPSGQGGEAVVLVNGQEALSFYVPQTEGWESYVSSKMGVLTLPAGKNSISIKAKQYNGFALMNLRKLSLTEITH